MITARGEKRIAELLKAGDIERLRREVFCSVFAFIYPSQENQRKAAIMLGLVLSQLNDDQIKALGFYFLKPPDPTETATLMNQISGWMKYFLEITKKP